MSIRAREYLKDKFKKGTRPSEEDFSDLLDSYLNKKNEGIDKTSEKGLELLPLGSNKKLLTFSDRCADEQNPDYWSFALFEKKLALLNNQGKALIDFSLESSSVRLGQQQFNYVCDSIPADGKFHNILPGEDFEPLWGSHSFEIIAVLNPTTPDKSSPFCFSKAQLIIASPKIKRWWLNGADLCVKAIGRDHFFDIFTHPIVLKCKRIKRQGYMLQMKSRRKYKDQVIEYYINSLAHTGPPPTGPVPESPEAPEQKPYEPKQSTPAFKE